MPYASNSSQFFLGPKNMSNASICSSIISDFQDAILEMQIQNSKRNVKN